MEIKLTILKPFFEKNNEAFHIREVAKLTGINHTTVRKYLQDMAKDGILAIKEDKLYDMYMAANSPAFRNIHLYYALETFRKSKFLADIEKNDNDAAVILLNFSESAESYNLCVIHHKNHEYSVKEFEKEFGKKISVKYYDHKKLLNERPYNNMKMNNMKNMKYDALLSQSIMNGNVIFGKVILTDVKK